MEESQEFSRLCKVNGLNVGEVQLQLLGKYVDLLLDWNSKINLVSRQDQSNIWTRHILPSISLLFHLDIQPSARILDLGTGGGLPGIPLAILRPDLELTLLDSTRKKILAVNDMVQNLNLKNVKTICGRAGELRLDRMKDVGFDIVVARAVASTTELIKWSSQLVRHVARKVSQTADLSGQLAQMSAKMPFLLAMKGGDLEDEIAAARVKFRNHEIRCMNLSILGLRDQEFIDKRVIIVRL